MDVTRIHHLVHPRLTSSRNELIRRALRLTGTVWHYNAFTGVIMNRGPGQSTDRTLPLPPPSPEAFCHPNMLSRSRSFWALPVVRHLIVSGIVFPRLPSGFRGKPRVDSKNPRGIPTVGHQPPAIAAIGHIPCRPHCWRRSLLPFSVPYP
jgi:hypothetical protein